MTQAIEQRPVTPANPLIRLYKLVTVGILLVGMGLDVLLVLMGPELLLRHVLTPLGELILTIWMASALVLGLVVYPHLDLHRRVTRIVQRVILVYFVLLVLLHGINNLLLGNTAGYLAAFSAPAYPYVAAAVLLAAAVFTAGLNPKPSSRRFMDCF